MTNTTTTPTETEVKELNRQGAARRLKTLTTRPGARPDDNRRPVIERSSAYTTEKLVLNSHFVQYFYERNIDELNGALQRLSLASYHRKSADKAVEEAAVAREKEATELLVTFDADVKTLCDKMQALEDEIKSACDAAGIPADKQVASYSNARTFNAPVVVPQSKRFLRLMQSYDRLVARTEGAWLNEVADNAFRMKTIESWRHQLFELVIHVKRNTTIVFTKQRTPSE